MEIKIDCRSKNNVPIELDNVRSHNNSNGANIGNTFLTVENTPWATPRTLNCVDGHKLYKGRIQKT